MSEVKGSECSVVYGQVVTHRACEQTSLCGNPYLSSLSAFNSTHSESLAAAANQLAVFVFTTTVSGLLMVVRVHLIGGPEYFVRS